MDMAYLAKLESDLQKRIEEIHDELRETGKVLGPDENNLKGDDEKMLLHTGIPNVAVFKFILGYLDSALTSNIRCEKV